MSDKVTVMAAEFSLEVDDLANEDFSDALLDFLEGDDKDEVEVLDFRVNIPNEVLLSPPEGHDSIDSTLSVTMSIKSELVNGDNVIRIRDRLVSRVTKAVIDVVVVH